MTKTAKAQKTENIPVLEKYYIGDRGHRPWGDYIVTAAGPLNDDEEFCEKIITVNPGKILSLQSHEFRREHWRVELGLLTVVLDGERRLLGAGQSIHIPLQAIHCMANLSDKPCLVHERQEGICREEDIIRYIDAYGRGTETAKNDPRITASIERYTEILEEIESTV